MNNALALADTSLDALEMLRHYLRQWVRSYGNWRPSLGYPKQVSYVRLMKGNLTHDGDPTYEDEIDKFAIGVIEAAIESLPRDHATALRVYYLNENGPSVYRSGRLDESQDAVKRLASEAERLLIPLCRQRNLIL